MKLNGQVLQWGFYLPVGKFSLFWHQYSERWFCLQSSKCRFVEIQKVWFLAYYLSRIPLTWWDSTILHRGGSFQTLFIENKNTFSWQRWVMVCDLPVALSQVHTNSVSIVRHHKCYQLVFPLQCTSRVQDQTEEMSCWPVVVSEILLILASWISCLYLLRQISCLW